MAPEGRARKDPEGGKTGEGKGGQFYFFGITKPFPGEEERGSPGSSGSAGSVAETERRPAESVAERLRLKEQEARDAAERRSRDYRRKLRDQKARDESSGIRQEKNDASDEDNSKWERAEAGWEDEDQEDSAKAARHQEMEEDQEMEENEEMEEES